MKRIVYELDGQLAIVTPVINTMGEAEGFTEDDALARASQKLPDGAENVQILDAEAIPADRTFRDAWRVDRDKIKIDMPRARDILRTKLREFRAEKMGSLDVEYQRADETKNDKKKAAVIAEKQVLRDLPAHPKIEQAQTVEELLRFHAEVTRELVQ